MTLMPNPKDTKRNLVCPLAMNERHHHIDDDQIWVKVTRSRVEESRCFYHGLGLMEIIQNIMPKQSLFTCLAYVVCASSAWYILANGADTFASIVFENHQKSLIFNFSIIFSACIVKIILYKFFKLFKVSFSR